MIHTLTTGAMPSVDGEMLIHLVEINGIPSWRDAGSGRTFPQVAGGEDPPPGEGDDSEGDDTDEHADDDESLDKARRRIQSLRTGEKSLKARLKAQEQELTALKAKQKEREDAEKSEAERLKEQLAEAERKAADTSRELQETRNRQAIERAAVKAGAADPDDVYRLLDPSEFERDDSGKLTNADDLVKALLKAKPYLAGKSNGTSGVPSTPRSNGQPQGHDERVEKNREKLRASGAYEPL